MSFFKVLLLSILFAKNILKTTSNRHRIIGGITASSEQFPYQVSLRRTSDNRHFCGGSIISSSWFLTAAHCMRDYPNIEAKSIKAVVGTISRSSGIAYGVSKVITTDQPFDIAVLQSDTLVKFNVNVQPVRLANENPPDSSIVVLSGWGYTNYPILELQDELKYIHLKTIPLSLCSALLPMEPVDFEHICTLTVVNEGSCMGDSGGPLVTVDGSQVGVVSFGIPCAAGKPDVYASVAAHRKWIFDHTGV